jgi:hypothetical protein
VTAAARIFPGRGSFERDFRAWQRDPKHSMKAALRERLEEEGWITPEDSAARETPVREQAEREESRR